MLSLMHLPFMKAFWGRLTIEGSTAANLLAIIFVIHLYRVFQHAMGRKSLTVDALGTFGIRVRIVALISFSR